MNFLNGNISFKSYFDRTDYRHEVPAALLHLNDESILSIYSQIESNDGLPEGSLTDRISASLNAYRSLLEQTELLIDCIQIEQSYPQPQISCLYNQFSSQSKGPINLALFKTFLADTVNVIAPCFSPQQLIAQNSLDKVFQSLSLLLTKESPVANSPQSISQLTPQTEKNSSKKTSSKKTWLTVRLQKIFNEKLPFIIKILEELESNPNYQAKRNLSAPYQKFREMVPVMKMSYADFFTFIHDKISGIGIKDSPFSLHRARNLALTLKNADAPIQPPLKVISKEVDSVTDLVAASTPLSVLLPASNKKKSPSFFAQSRLTILKHTKSLIQAVEKTEQSKASTPSLKKALHQFNALTGLTIDKIIWRRFLKEMVQRHFQGYCPALCSLIKQRALANILKSLSFKK